MWSCKAAVNVGNIEVGCLASSALRSTRVAHQKKDAEKASLRTSNLRRRHRAMVGLSMDEDRKIRFLVAPILFVASLLLGALSDQGARDFIVRALEDPNWSKSIGIIAGGGVVVFAAGYIIGTCTQFLLRLIFWCRPRRWGRSRFHEVALSEDSFGRIWDRMGAPGKPDRSQELSAGAAFDYDVLRKSHEGVHRWLFRRWNGFNTAANSISALVLSFLAGPFIGVTLGRTWCLSVLIFAVVLGFVMVWAWRDTMNMVGFMASLEEKPTLGETPGLADDVKGPVSNSGPG
jgi:hypothetical protein